MADDLSNLWGIHSEKNQRPVFRGWARSKGEAEKRMAEIKAEDAESADDRYWITHMTKAQVAGFKGMGAIPNDA